MPKLTDDLKVENGMVLGYVRTWMTGSECVFEICSVEEWEEMTEEEAEKTARETMYESGMMEWG